MDAVGPPEPPSQPFWTNASVRAFAGDEDPIEAVVARAREVVLDAVQRGWGGPPFDPLVLARKLDLEVVPHEDLADARVRRVGDHLRVEFNPNRPAGRLRYSIAHEIAHTFFEDVGDEVRHRTGTGAIERVDDDSWQLELLCNVAAGELLVPSVALPNDGLDDAVLDINELMALRRRFDVSTEAMLRRAAQATSHAVSVFAAARAGETERRFRLDYVVPSWSWGAAVGRGATVESAVLAECTAVGFTSTGVESWSPQDGDLGVQAVGIPPYPGDRLPRIAGVLVRDSASRVVHRIRYVAGDATQPHGAGPRIIAHVVNDQARAWGGQGFAMQLQRRHPQAAQAFKAWTIARPDNLRLGNVHVVELADGICVASMVAQEGYGASDQPRLRYGALSRCLDAVRRAALTRGASVHMPPIGLGQGGGAWPVIADDVEQSLSRQEVDVTVYVPPGEHGHIFDRGAPPTP